MYSMENKLIVLNESILINDEQETSLVKHYLLNDKKYKIVFFVKINAKKDNFRDEIQLYGYHPTCNEWNFLEDIKSLKEISIIEYDNWDLYKKISFNDLHKLDMVEMKKYMMKFFEQMETLLINVYGN